MGRLVCAELSFTDLFRVKEARSAVAPTLDLMSSWSETDLKRAILDAMTGKGTEAADRLEQLASAPGESEPIETETTSP